MANQKRMRLLAVVGPTASGKSALAVALAKALGGEVISCDSMQVYRHMNIGTAKPTEAEKQGVAHHLIDVAEPDQAFSCAQYVSLAAKCIEELHQRDVLPILCGGTGLYLDSLLRGGFEETESDPVLRQSLFDYAAQYGNHALHQRLLEVDPESAASIHENNVKRVVRALEIYESTGVTKTESDRRSCVRESPYDATVIGLRYPEREILYDRIEKRVDEMLKSGLWKETEQLLCAGVFERNSTAAQAIGYKELLGCLQGGQDAGEAVQELKRATRRYAKRQMTWFGGKDYVRWIDMTANGKVRSLASVAEEALAIWST